MDENFQPYFPNDESMGNNKNAYKDSKYMYALKNIIFYAVLTPDGSCLSYYKEGQIALEDDSPEVLRFLQSEFEGHDFHDRYWLLREWVAEQKRLNPACGVEFEEQRYDQLLLDLAQAGEEADDIINGAG